MHPNPTTALVPARSAASAELFLRRAQLAVLRAELAAREATLTQLRNQLHSFEGRYIRQVGVLYRQLDEWEARIAELEVAHESIEETERLLREASQTPTTNPGAPCLASETWATTDPQTPTLKTLFREVAKRIHPDFALTPTDALHRTHLMALANDALRRADAALLHRMLHSHDLPHRPLTTAQALTETLTLLNQTQADLAALNAEIQTLTQSEMADLRHRTHLAALRGRDLLAELAAQVKGRIGLAMRRYELDLARIRRNQPAFNPEALLSAEIRNS